MEFISKMNGSSVEGIDFENNWKDLMNLNKNEWKSINRNVCLKDTKIDFKRCYIAKALSSMLIIGNFVENMSISFQWIIQCNIEASPFDWIVAHSIPHVIKLTFLKHIVSTFHCFALANLCSTAFCVRNSITSVKLAMGIERMRNGALWVEIHVDTFRCFFSKNFIWLW